MHSAVMFFVCWGLAFVTLCLALVLLNVYSGVVGGDLGFRSLPQEMFIAGLASLVEGGSIWLCVAFVPAAVPRALFIPALMVAVLYKVGHLEDWSRYDIVLLLVFQVVICLSGACLYFGHFLILAIIWAGFGVFLMISASFARSLGD